MGRELMSELLSQLLNDQNSEVRLNVISNLEEGNSVSCLCMRAGGLLLRLDL